MFVLFAPRGWTAFLPVYGFNGSFVYSLQIRWIGIFIMSVAELEIVVIAHILFSIFLSVETSTTEIFYTTRMSTYTPICKHRRRPRSESNQILKTDGRGYLVLDLTDQLEVLNAGFSALLQYTSIERKRGRSVEYNT